jgi:hypothetical protein
VWHQACQGEAKKRRRKSLQIVAAKLLEYIACSVVARRNTPYVELIFHELDFANAFILAVNFLEKVHSKRPHTIVFVAPCEEPHRSLIESVRNFRDELRRKQTTPLRGKEFEALDIAGFLERRVKRRVKRGINQGHCFKRHTKPRI